MTISLIISKFFKSVNFKLFNSLILKLSFFVSEPFLLFIFQWIMYAYFHLNGLLSGLGGKEAYYINPFELEAYDNDEKENYLNERKSYAWIDYWRKL